MSNRFRRNKTSSTDSHFENSYGKNIPKSIFPQKKSHRTTMNFGSLIPLHVEEVLPGDIRKGSLNFLARTSTPIHPVMDNAWYDLYAFFVPYRIIWEDSKAFFGENKEGSWDNVRSDYIIPKTVTPSGGYSEDDVASYMGVPIKVGGVEINSLPFRAYAKIYNDWFRDQNIQKDAFLDYSSGVTSGESGGNPILTGSKGGAPFKVNRYKDYFTSALPEPQKADDVLIPLLGEAPVFAYGDVNDSTGFLGNDLKWVRNDGVRPANNVERTVHTQFGSDSSGDLTVFRPSSDTGSTDSVVPANLKADLSRVTGSSINELRWSIVLQQFAELDARGGSRYNEMLYSHFGIVSDDARLQRAEFITSARELIDMQQVAQTSSSDQVSAQGNVSGLSVTAGMGHTYSHTAKEHGIFMVLGCARTEQSYQQGLHKMWTRVERTDFYDPLFANIGEQPIKMQEIYLTSNSDSNNSVFGYQEPWVEHRVLVNQVSGSFRSNAVAPLDSWHYSRFFGGAPSLTPSFMEQTADEVDRTLAVKSTAAPQLILDFQLDGTKIALMPTHGTPGLKDI